MSSAAPPKRDTPPRQVWQVRCLCADCIRAEPWKASLLEQHKDEQQRMFRRLYRKQGATR